MMVIQDYPARKTNNSCISLTMCSPLGLKLANVYNVLALQQLIAQNQLEHVPA